MNITEVNTHQHKVSPKYGNIRSYLARIENRLEDPFKWYGSEIAHKEQLMYLNIIKDTISSLIDHNEIFEKQVIKHLKDEEKYKARIKLLESKISKLRGKL